MLIKKIELAKDSCGAGQFRGGLGLDLEFEMLEETYITTVVERTKFPPWGINKGKEGRANNVEVLKKSGINFYMPKKSGYKLSIGDSIVFKTGGGGGYGSPSERDKELIKNDLKQGYLSKEYVLQNYKHYY